MKFGKEYFEEYALLSLEKCYDTAFSHTNFKKDESPDWQSEELETGIEVSRALSKEEGERQFIVNEYFGRGLGGELIRKAVQKRFSKHGDLIKVIDNTAYVTNEVNSFSEKYGAIEDRIIEKTKKLNDNYRLFKNNYLYVFANTGLLAEWDIEFIFNRIKDKLDSYSKQFDKVFIYSYDKIWVYSNAEIQLYVIPKETVTKLYEETKQFCD